MLFGLCWIGVIGSAIYLASSLYARDWLGATNHSAHSMGSDCGWLALNKPYLGYLFLTLAGFGALLTGLLARRRFATK